MSKLTKEERQQLPSSTFAVESKFNAIGFIHPYEIAIQDPSSVVAAQEKLN